MSARYLKIDALQPPYDLGVDEAGRSKMQFNIATERTSPTGVTGFEEEIGKILQDAGVGTYTGATIDIFFGSNAKIPAGKGPFIQVISTSGLPGRKIQNTQGVEYKQPTALIVVRATDYVVARAKIFEALAALEVVRNQTVTT